MNQGNAKKLILKLVKKSIEDKNISIAKSKILGNAIYLIKIKDFPVKIDLINDKYFLKNSDEDKKFISQFLEQMKFPNFNFTDNFSKIIDSQWVNKNFVKKQVENKSISESKKLKIYTKKNVNKEKSVIITVKKKKNIS